MSTIDNDNTASDDTDAVGTPGMMGDDPVVSSVPQKKHDTIATTRARVAAVPNPTEGESCPRQPREHVVVSPGETSRDSAGSTEEQDGDDMDDEDASQYSGIPTKGARTMDGEEDQGRNDAEPPQDQQEGEQQQQQQEEQQQEPQGQLDIAEALKLLAKELRDEMRNNSETNTKALEEMGKKIDDNSKTNTKALETLQEEMGTLRDEMGKKLDKLLRVNPRANLPNGKFIYGSAEDAVVNGGASTWSALKRTAPVKPTDDEEPNDDGKTTEYALGSLHCAARTKVRDDKLTLLLPRQLDPGRVKAVGLLLDDAWDRSKDDDRQRVREELSNTNVYARGDKNAGRDIIFLQLDDEGDTEEGAKGCPADAFEWHDDDAEKNHGGTFLSVAGYSHSQEVVGRYTRYVEPSVKPKELKANPFGYYVVMLDFGERGNSGTAVFGFDKSNEGRLLGVFYGRPSAEKLGMDLKPPGSLLGQSMGSIYVGWSFLYLLLRPSPGSSLMCNMAPRITYTLQLAKM